MFRTELKAINRLLRSVRFDELPMGMGALSKFGDSDDKFMFKVEKPRKTVRKKAVRAPQVKSYADPLDRELEALRKKLSHL